MLSRPRLPSTRPAPHPFSVSFFSGEGSVDRIFTNDSSRATTIKSSNSFCLFSTRFSSFLISRGYRCSFARVGSDLNLNTLLRVVNMVFVWCVTEDPREI